MIAQIRLGVIAGLFGMSTACAVAGPPSTWPTEPRVAAATIVVENHTSYPFRVVLVANRTARPLGTVPALETREFTLPSSIDATSDEVHLVASVRDGLPDRRTSLAFHVPAGRTAKWTLDGTRLPSVIVR